MTLLHSSNQHLINTARGSFRSTSIYLQPIPWNAISSPLQRKHLGLTTAYLFLEWKLNTPWCPSKSVIGWKRMWYCSHDKHLKHEHFIRVAMHRRDMRAIEYILANVVSTIPGRPTDPVCGADFMVSGMNNWLCLSFLLFWVHGGRT